MGCANNVVSFTAKFMNLMMRRCTRRDLSHGFTLVELLVVIGIIAILGAISFGAVTSALAHAKMAKCTSNLRSIGVAMLSFAADNNGNLPESGKVVYYNATDSATGAYGWTQQLEPYIGTDRTVFQCPDSSKSISSNANYSYFNGAHAAQAEGGAGSFGPVCLAKMRNASEHIIAGDIAFPGGVNDPNDTDKDDYSQDPAFGGGTVANPIKIPIHMGSSNILYADGHVQSAKAFDPANMSTVYSDNNVTYLSP